MVDRPTIKVLHKLPNRVRVKFSLPIKNTRIFQQILKEGTEHTEIRYNSLNQTLLTSFDPNEILLQEMIYRISAAYSIEKGMLAVKLIEEVEEKYLTPLTMYSGGAISLAAVNKLLNSNGMELQNSMNWFAMGTTGVAIFEHAYTETKKKGVFDIEILPALYFMRSFFKNPSLSIVTLTWLTTFGRHLFTTHYGAKEIKVLRIKSPKDGKYYYNVNISEDRSISNASDFLHHLFFARDKKKVKSEEKYIMISNG